MDWQQEGIAAAIIGGLFLLIFAIAELWRYYRQPPAELTRKLVHFSGGTVALSFSYIFQSHWTILILDILFLAIIVISKHTGYLQSVHGVDRKSSGGEYFPIAVYACFLIASLKNEPHFYVISILVLAISDSMAALVGSRYGFKLYRVEADQEKSIEGSTIFFLVTFVIVHLGLLLLSDIGRAESVLAAVIIALVVTGFEAISLGGTDNLFIPFGVIFILARLTYDSAEEMLRQLGILLLISLFVIFISRSRRKLGSSGLLGIALAGYGAWALIGFDWFIPIAIGFILFSYLDVFAEQPQTHDELFRIQPVFYMLALSTCWVLVTNMFDGYEHMFVVPYIISLAANLSILWKRRAALDIAERGQISKKILNWSYPLRALFLTIIFLLPQLWIDDKLSPLFAFFSCFCGIMLADRLYLFWGRRYMAQKEERIHFLRLGAVMIGVASIFIFTIGIYFYVYFAKI